MRYSDTAPCQRCNKALYATQKIEKLLQQATTLHEIYIAPDGLVGLRCFSCGHTVRCHDDSQAGLDTGLAISLIRQRK